jgi:hypothetical protein
MGMKKELSTLRRQVKEKNEVVQSREAQVANLLSKINQLERELGETKTENKSLNKGNLYTPEQYYEVIWDLQEEKEVSKNKERQLQEKEQSINELRESQDKYRKKSREKTLDTITPPTKEETNQKKHQALLKKQIQSKFELKGHIDEFKIKTNYGLPPKERIKQVKKQVRKAKIIKFEISLQTAKTIGTEIISKKTEKISQTVSTLKTNVNEATKKTGDVVTVATKKTLASYGSKLKTVSKSVSDFVQSKVKALSEKKNSFDKKMKNEIKLKKIKAKSMIDNLRRQSTLAKDKASEVTSRTAASVKEDVSMASGMVTHSIKEKFQNLRTRFQEINVELTEKEKEKTKEKAKEKYTREVG